MYHSIGCYLATCFTKGKFDEFKIKLLKASDLNNYG